MDREYGFGRLNCNGSPMRPDCNCVFAIYRQVPVNGTRLSIASFFISPYWRGKPLISHQVIGALIAATSTKTGLKVGGQIDSNLCPSRLKV